METSYAYKDGRKSAEDGIPLCKNPFFEFTPAYKIWIKGWVSVFTERKERAARGQKINCTC